MAGKLPIGYGKGGKPLFEDDLKKMGIKDPLKPYSAPDPTRWKVKGKSKKEVEALIAKMEKKQKKNKKPS